MSYRILFVDDDPNILDAYRRQLRKQFDIDTAIGGEEALDLIQGIGSRISGRGTDVQPKP